MAEEWGTVIIKTEIDLLKKLKTTREHPEQALVEMATITVQDYSEFIDLDFHIDSIKIKSGYAYIEFNCSELHLLTRFFINAEKNLEWYARIQDEYGTCYFYALNKNKEKYSFEFDQGGDLGDDEDYENNVMAQLDNWINFLPSDLKNPFPQFITTDNFIFDGP